MKAMALALVLTFPSAVLAAEELVVHHGLIRAAAIPPGYSLTKDELKYQDKVIGTRLLLKSDKAYGHVSVMIEPRELLTDSQKVAAAKGYINGSSQGLVQGGLKIVEQKIPDPIDVNKPIIVPVVFENALKQRIHVSHRIVFQGTRGCSISTFHNAGEDIAALNVWASTIGPVE
jgi:hypothetical protein